MMIVGSLSACFFTIVSVFMEDHCILLDYTEGAESVSGVSNLYPDQLVPILDTCMFGESKNAAIDLGLET